MSCGGVPVVTFQSTLSMRRATYRQILKDGLFEFQSTLSMRRATRQPNKSGCQDAFQSTLSMRRATYDAVQRIFHIQHFNPRSP